MLGDPPDSHPKTETLANQAMSDPQVAFNLLYERIAPALTAWANIRIPAALTSRLEPEDLVQEVWVRAMSKVSTFDPKRSSFRAWIFRVAKLVLLENFRRLNSSTVAADKSSSAGVESVPAEITSVCHAAARNEHVLALARFTETLNEDERKLLLHRGLEGLPHNEVAAILGVDREVAMKRWQRLRARAADELALMEMLDE